MIEHPHQGGSYRREPDGSLTRIIDLPPPEAILPRTTAEKLDDAKPSKRKEKKNG